MEKKPNIFVRFYQAAGRGFELWKDLVAFYVFAYIVVMLAILALGVLVNLWSTVFPSY